jgi:hypothetical protein
MVNSWDAWCTNAARLLDHHGNVQMEMWIVRSSQA